MPGEWLPLYLHGIVLLMEDCLNGGTDPPLLGLPGTASVPVCQTAFPTTRSFVRANQALDRWSANLAWMGASFHAHTLARVTLLG